MTSSTGRAGESVSWWGLLVAGKHAAERGKHVDYCNHFRPCGWHWLGTRLPLAERDLGAHSTHPIAGFPNNAKAEWGRR